jgi:hypothetical protein
VGRALRAIGGGGDGARSEMEDTVEDGNVGLALGFKG